MKIALFAVLLSLLAFSLATRAGVLTLQSITTDASSGISSSKIYTHAVDLARGGSDPHGGNDGNQLFINGVPFTSGGQSGLNYTLTGAGFGSDGWPANAATGGIADMLDDFYYNQDGSGNEDLTLTGLTAGQHYLTVFYVGTYGPTLQDITPSDDSVTRIGIPRDAGAGNAGWPAGMLLYDYIAPGSGQINFHFNAQVNSDSFHQYGFTNEVVPEPAALALLALGLLALPRRRRA